MVDPTEFVHAYGHRIYHMHVKESVRNLNGRNGILGSHLFFGDHRRGWDFVSPGRGGVPWERCFRALNDVGYAGPLSVEWEDNGMNREQGAPEALAMIRRLGSPRRTSPLTRPFRPRATEAPRSQEGDAPRRVALLCFLRPRLDRLGTERLVQDPGDAVGMGGCVGRLGLVGLIGAKARYPLVGRGQPQDEALGPLGVQARHGAPCPCRMARRAATGCRCTADRLRRP